MFQMGAELGHTMNILDLGGGFPGLEGAKVRFEEVCGQGWLGGHFVMGEGHSEHREPAAQYIWPVCHTGLSALLDFIATY